MAPLPWYRWEVIDKTVEQFILLVFDWKHEVGHATDLVVCCENSAAISNMIQKVGWLLNRYLLGRIKEPLNELA